MILSMQLKNIQGHRDTTIQFSNGINVLAGSSGAGKSTVLRALYWVVHNKPSGSSIISHWNQDKNGNPISESSVTLTTDDGYIVCRKRDKDFNGYTVSTVDSTESIKEFGAIGTGEPPPIILDILGMNGLNFHEQDDPYFLVSTTSGNVSKFLNSLVNLDIIDDTLSIAESRKRSVRKEAEDLAVKKQELENTLQETTWVDSATRMLSGFDTMKNVVDDLTKKETSLSTIISKIQDATVKYNTMLELTTRASCIIKQYNTSKDLIKSLQDRILRLSGTVSSVRELPSRGRVVLIESAEELIADIKKTKQAMQSKSDTAAKISALVSKYRASEVESASFLQLYRAVEKDLPPKCEACGQYMIGDHSD